MHNDDDVVRALIAGYKAREAPSGATRTKIQRALAAAQSETSARAGRMPRRRAAAAPWLALAAGLVLLVCWRVGWPWARSAGYVADGRGGLSSFAAAPRDPGLAAADRGAQETAQRAVDPDSEAADPGAPEGALAPLAAVDGPPEASTPAKPGPSAREGAPVGGGKRRKVRPVPAAPVADLADPVLEEMALLQQARDALRGGRPAGSLALLDRHADAFPGGLLVEEREALRVAALCASGRSAQGLAAQAEFMRAYPRSAYAGRVVAACPGPPAQKPGGSQTP